MHLLILSLLSYISGIINAKYPVYIYFAILVSAIFLANFKSKILQLSLILIFFYIGNIRYYQAKNLEIENHFLHENVVKNITAYVHDVLLMDKNTYKNYQTCLTVYINEPNKIKSFIKIYCFERIYIPIGSTINIKNLKIKSSSESQIHKENITGICFCFKLDYKITESKKWYDINAYIKNLRNNLDYRLKSKLNINTYNLFSEIFLGKSEQTTINTSIKDGFKNWGILHYLARSGFHINLIMSIIVKILQHIPINFFLKKFISILILFIYSLFSWTSVSFNRAYYSYTFYILFIFMKIPIYVDHVFGIITFLTLLHNPMLIFFLDFQLSYILTATLIIFNKFFKS